MRSAVLPVSHEGGLQAGHLFEGLEVYACPKRGNQTLDVLVHGVHVDLLDTNVLSALMRTTPDAVVVEWLDRQPSDSIWVTSITVFEGLVRPRAPAERETPQ